MSSTPVNPRLWPRWRRLLVYPLAFALRFAFVLTDALKIEDR